MRLCVLYMLFALCLVSCSWSQTLAAAPVEAAQQTPPPRPLRNNSQNLRDALDSIGARNVGCRRGFGNWYSLNHQFKVGKQYAKEIEATSKIITDPVISSYVNQIGQNLVRNSDSQVPFTIKVIDSDDVNAFALPGGFFFVDTGLIVAADDEAELAGVMAHEIAHVAACHMARERTRNQLMNLASIPLSMVGGPAGYLAYEGLTVATPLTFFKLARKFEIQADYLAVEYMYKAGYDPQALTSFFERVRKQEKLPNSFMVKAFQSHPPTADRIVKTQYEIATLPPERQYKLDTSEFQEVKARLERMQGGLRLQNPNRPKLRRRVSPGPGHLRFRYDTGTGLTSMAPKSEN